MIHPNWALVPGAGEQELERIGQSARTLNLFKHQEDRLAEFAGRLGAGAAAAEQAVIAQVMAEGDLTDFEGNGRAFLDTEQGRAIIVGHLAEASFARLQTLEQDVTPPPDRQVRVTVLKTGVQGGRLSRWQIPPPELLQKLPRIQTDEVFEGKLQGLHTSPRLGGVIAVRGGLFTTMHLSGLVNLATGKPQVNLELFAKKSDQA